MWYSSGKMNQATNGVVRSIAPNPAQAGVVLDQAQISYPDGDPRQAVQNVIRQGREAYRATALGKAETKPEAILQGTNKEIAEIVKRDAALIKEGDASNIYAPLPFASITESQAVQGTEFYQKVLAPQKAAGSIDVTPKQIFQQAQAAVKSGILTIDQAAEGVQTYFKAAVVQNNNARNYAGFGIPVQKTFRTQVTLPPISVVGAAGIPLAGVPIGAFAQPERTITIDLTDETQVRAALMRAQARNASGGLQ